LANNKIKTMAGLGGLTKLRKLDLGANRIREMDAHELSGLVSLEELWLGKNKIERIQGLESLTKLRRLDVQSNRLTHVDGLEAQRETLEELFLAHNGIDDGGVEGLKIAFTKLCVLDLGRNKLTTLRPFTHLVSLEELWVSGNLVADFEEVKPLIALVHLETIYLEYNPVQDAHPMYRRMLKDMLAPSLQQIDATPIGHQVVAAVETPEARNRRLQQLVMERALRQQQQEEEAKSAST
jgi:protein phosphatase 1 regulatory subunit 7